MLFRWIADDWSECSRTCGGGYRQRDVHCTQLITNEPHHRTNRTDRDCEQAGAIKPKSIIQNCNTNVCPPVWIAGEWGRVSSCQYLTTVSKLFKVPLWSWMVPSTNNMYELAIDKSPPTRAVSSLGKAAKNKTLPQTLPKAPVEIWKMERGNIAFFQLNFQSQNFKSARCNVVMGRGRVK